MPATNAEVIDNLAAAKDAALRVTARALIKAYADQIATFVTVLGEELGKHADTVAMRTGDYSRAAEINVVANHLTELGRVFENYDGAR